VEDCFGGVDFDNLFLCGVNKGIHCRNSGRLDIRRLRGQVFTCGVEIDECYDVPRLHNVHFWPYWSGDTTSCAGSRPTATPPVFRRSDGVFIDQFFALGYRSVFRFASSAAGVTTKFYIGQAYADFAKHALLVEGANTTGQIAGLTTQGEIFNGGGAPIPGSAGVLVTATGARLQIGNLRVDAVEDNPVRLEGSNNRLDLFSLRCVRFNTRANGAAAVHLADSGAAARTPSTSARRRCWKGRPRRAAGERRHQRRALEAGAGRPRRAPRPGRRRPRRRVLRAQAPPPSPPRRRRRGAARHRVGTVTLGGAPAAMPSRWPRPPRR
jgi:hypothetical protein